MNVLILPLFMNLSMFLENSVHTLNLLLGVLSEYFFELLFSSWDINVIIHIYYVAAVTKAIHHSVVLQRQARRRLCPFF